MMLALILAAALSDAPLQDAALEARAQMLMREIRCVSCENEPISQSASEIAGDMRHLVRSQIQDGASDEQVRSWFAERYGEFVLFRPKASGGGAFLWTFPFVLLAWVGGALFLGARAKRRRNLKPLKADASTHETNDHENDI
ncbi:cytochrome c-type biogenesis protein [Hirschia litorea]|uniref:Cytochrome c-type biogenesis protein n=1 Tax=Hirschia litorea TaxID=1199156 RepID=A0ABW2IIF6_9PROT